MDTNVSKEPVALIFRKLLGTKLGEKIKVKLSL
jgi:hypothetical protein